MPAKKKVDANEPPVKETSKEPTMGPEKWNNMDDAMDALEHCVCILYFVLYLAFIQYNVRTWPKFPLGLNSHLA